MMVSQDKSPYIAPLAIVTEVEFEGMICTSTGDGIPTYNPFNSEQTW